MDKDTIGIDEWIYRFMVVCVPGLYPMQPVVYTDERVDVYDERLVWTMRGSDECDIEIVPGKSSDRNVLGYCVSCNPLKRDGVHVASDDDERLGAW